MGGKDVHSNEYKTDDEKKLIIPKGATLADIKMIICMSFEDEDITERLIDSIDDTGD